MAKMKNGPLSECTNNEGWLCRVWNSVRLVGVGKFANPASFSEGYGMRPSPRLELVRIKGSLALQGRNQTMKMLIEERPGAPRANP
jgi:hypothetical protein